MYINGQLGNPRALRFTGAAGIQQISVLAATPENYFDTGQVAVEVLGCDQPVEYLDVAVSPGLYAEYTVEFAILNADAFSAQAPTYVWDFGDGRTLETESPAVSHSYAASMEPERPSTVFEARITMLRAGREDLTASKTVTVWNMSSYASGPLSEGVR